MTAAEIAARLGGAYRSGRWWRCLCPSHGSRTGRSATLALRDGERGLIAVCHAGCDRADVIAALRGQHLLGGDGDCRRPDAVMVRRGDDSGDGARRTVLARRAWDAAQDARGSPVARYLAGRGITIAPPPSLRWAPSLRRPDGTSGPAMVARIDGLDGDLIGIARTWLVRDAAGVWRRRDRAMLGRAAGAAVLMVAEGIETALSATQATEMPAWAALSTSGMRALALPSIVRRIIILADNDENGAGERAARAAAQRWLAEGRRVRIALPPVPGTDIVDVLTGRTYARITEACDAAA